jgi:hypothetical protein
MKSNFKDNAVSPKISASQGNNAKLMTPIKGLHTQAASPGKHPFKPADPLRKSKGSRKSYA